MNRFRTNGTSMMVATSRIVRNSELHLLGCGIVFPRIRKWQYFDIFYTSVNWHTLFGELRRELDQFLALYELEEKFDLEVARHLTIQS